MIRREFSPEAPVEETVREDDASPSAPSDSAVLERFVSSGDAASFEELVRRHQRLVMGVCARILGNAHAAEDAFQETFLALARRAASIRAPGSLSSWLHRVAANEALRLRVQARRRALREAAAVRPELGPPEALPLEERQIHALVDEALAELPEKYRMPLILRYLEGLSTESAADRLGHPQGSMSTLLARGLELLRSGLREKGVAVSGGLLAGSLSMLSAQAQAAAPALVAGAVRSALLYAGTQASGVALTGALKAVAAAVLLSVAVGGAPVPDLPEPFVPLPTSAPLVAAPPPPPPAPPDPARIRAELRRPSPPPAVPEPEKPDKSEKPGKAEKPEAPEQAEKAAPPPIELPDLPGSASERAQAALKHAAERREARGEPPGQGKKGNKPDLPPGLERANEAAQKAKSASERAHEAVQRTRGRSGK